MDNVPGFVLKVGVLGLVGLATGAHAGTPVTTYHNDNLRTGWLSGETSLTPATVSSNAFGLLGQISLDEQVDAEPLFLPSQQVNGSTVDVVYVATENNTIYMIDAQHGTTLLSRNLGTPVSVSSLPGQCNNNSNNVGINSTPVIDAANGILYVMTKTAENGQAVFRMHALDTATLADRTPNTVVGATGMRTDGSQISFSAGYERQRAALLLSSGNIYAAFASYCDMGTNISRGWMLGWKASTLAALPANELIDRRPSSPNNYYMSAIWMSGYGPSAGPNGDVYFSTSNSDPSGTAYNPVSNLSESVVRMSPDLSAVHGHYTSVRHGAEDKNDNDFGSGGVMLVPPQSGSPAMAVTAGKVDSIFLLNRDLFTTKTGDPSALVLGTYPNFGCWCGPSYYTGSDGIGRVVTSVGENVSVWKVNTGSSPSLTKESTGPAFGGGDDPGFFTSISSNGTQAGSAVIWAVPHSSDDDSNHTLYLKALDPAHGSRQIFSAAAGSWPFASNSNSNVVPLVADGRVFVASYEQISIFGLSADGNHVAATMVAHPEIVRTYPEKHQLHGLLVSKTGSTLTLRLRDGRVVAVDTSLAAKNFKMADMAPGQGVQLRGSSYDAAGLLQASVVLHAKDAASLWDADK